MKYFDCKRIVNKNRKLAAIVCSTGVAIQGVFFTEYNIPTTKPNQKHVFSEVQSTFRSYVDRYIFDLDPKDEKANATSDRKDS